MVSMVRILSDSFRFFPSPAVFMVYICPQQQVQGTKGDKIFLIVIICHRLSSKVHCIHKDYGGIS